MRETIFTVTYILLPAVALCHGLYGLRTILFELTLKPAAERAVSPPSPRSAESGAHALDGGAAV
jgi:hypothetical protein